MKFLDEMEGLKRIALGVKKYEKAVSQRNKVASEICYMKNEPALVKMINFIVAYKKNSGHYTVRC